MLYTNANAARVFQARHRVKGEVPGSDFSYAGIPTSTISVLLDGNLKRAKPNNFLVLDCFIFLFGWTARELVPIPLSSVHAKPYNKYWT